MTPIQISNKIEDLSFWLKHNPNHPDRVTVESDLRNLKNKLIGQEND